MANLKNDRVVKLIKQGTIMMNYKNYTENRCQGGSNTYSTFLYKVMAIPSVIVIPLSLCLHPVLYAVMNIVFVLLSLCLCRVLRHCTGVPVKSVQHQGVGVRWQASQ